mgnify:FL=1
MNSITLRIIHPLPLMKTNDVGFPKECTPSELKNEKKRGNCSLTLCTANLSIYTLTQIVRVIIDYSG